MVNLNAGHRGISKRGKRLRASRGGHEVGKVVEERGGWSRLHWLPR